MRPDYIVVGSGVNGLVAAAMLGKKGKRILVLERNDRIGGAIRTEEITASGYVHDVMATTFVLFLLSPAYGALGADLAARGLEFAHGDYPTGSLLPDGRQVIFTKDRAKNVAAFNALCPGDGERFAADMDRLGANAPLIFSLLGGNLWSWPMLKTLLGEAWRRGPRGLAEFFGEGLVTARGWLEPHYRSDVVQALWAPWVLHTGLGPEAAYSGQMAKVIAFALEAAGAPIVKGGAQRFLDSFSRLIMDQNGVIRTSAEVERVLLDDRGAARAVRLSSGEEIEAEAGIICSVTPHQLYERFLSGVASISAVQSQVSGFRYGRGNMQIHYALKKPAQWPTAELGRVALLHLTAGLDGVSRAVNEAERGLLPVEPTICVGQPTALDSSRAPDGAAILWLQLPEAPRVLKGDAAGEIKVPKDGRWTETVREAFANRIEAMLAHHIKGFARNVVKRRSYSPADLETMNINLVGGDPYGGHCGIDQFFIWRPVKGAVNHKTPVPRLYHIGASTHPGPGLGGGSGFLLANSLR
jgi:phytoene dehydrogenase-like protein